MYQPEQSSSLFLGGQRTTGQNVRSSNGKHMWVNIRHKADTPGK